MGKHNGREDRHDTGGAALIGVLALFAAAGCAPTPETWEEHPLRAFGAQTRNTGPVCIEMKLDVRSADGDEYRAALTLWADRDSRRYAVRADGTETGSGGTRRVGMGLLRTPKTAVRWTTRDGALVNARRLPREGARLPPFALEQPYLCIFFDAVRGYPSLVRQLVLDPGRPPGRRDDGLVWYRARTPRRGADWAFHRRLRLHKIRLWLGFSRADGWPRAVVFRYPAQRTRGAFTVRRIRAARDPAGAFDLPPEVKARLAAGGPN